MIINHRSPRSSSSRTGFPSKATELQAEALWGGGLLLGTLYTWTTRMGAETLTQGRSQANSTISVFLVFTFKEETSYGPHPPQAVA